MQYDVIVIGAGVMGLATAAELGRRGQKVLLLEQFGIPNDLGSSHGETRVIRTAYFEHPDYVPLAQRAWHKWQELGHPSRTRIIVRTGGLYVGPPESELILGSIEAAKRHGLSYSLGDEKAVQARARIVIPEGYVTFWEAECGIIMASAAIARLAAQCNQLGVEMRAFESVTSWQASPNGVSVTTTNGTFESGRLVICAGPWSRSVMANLNLPLVVTRQTVAYTEPAEASAYSIISFPVACFEAKDGAFFYTIPTCQTDSRHKHHFKVGRHNSGEVVDPNEVDRIPTPEDAETALAGLRRFIPGAAQPLRGVDVCLYTSTPDGHFVVDRHPEHENVAFACGFSGHGFKFAPVIGEALADLSLNGKTDLPIDFLSASRFSR